MGVDFSRGNAGMTEHFLDNTKVCPVFHKMRGKGMTEGVGRDILVHTSQKSLPLDYLEH